MAFSLPTFNLTCEIWTGSPLGLAPRLTSPCNLSAGRRVVGTLQDTWQWLLLPAGTDIRDNFSTSLNDFVVVPAGVGGYWVVNAVYDVARGFANGYRAAALVRTRNPHSGADWPTPYP